MRALHGKIVSSCLVRVLIPLDKNEVIPEYQEGISWKGIKN